MTDDAVVEWIHSKYENLAGDLDERARRRWAAVEALSLGRGGIAAVTRATGISDRTIRNGIRELREGDAPPSGRQRRVGGGRKAVSQAVPGLLDALDGLVEPTTRGDPQSPLKWTCKSTRELAGELNKCRSRLEREPLSRRGCAGAVVTVWGARWNAGGSAWGGAMGRDEVGGLAESYGGLVKGQTLYGCPEV
jgi:hypothetical protein